VDLTQNIARKSAQLLAHENIGFADSIVWATAETQGIVLWTLDRRLANKSTNIRYLLEF
jgi:predicted nucleic acid-binding protein